MGSKNLYHLLVEHNTIRLFRFLSMDQKQADDDPINAPGSKVPTAAWWLWRILYGSFDQLKPASDHHYSHLRTSGWSPPPPLMRGRAATALGCSSGGMEQGSPTSRSTFSSHRKGVIVPPATRQKGHLFN